MRNSNGQSYRRDSRAPQTDPISESEMWDLKSSTVRGGLSRLCAQGAALLLRVASLVVLARLLKPSDFGLVGMVTAFTGVLTLLRDFGLSSAAIQWPSITPEQISTLFWINMLVGALMSLAAVGMAPAIAHFYHQPSLFWMTSIVAMGFLFNAAGVQHAALLQRRMRFTALSVINIFSSAVGYVLAIAAAAAGFRYWALVTMPVATPLAATIGFWLTSAWVPGMPRGSAEVRSMLRFGSILTLNGLVAYIAFNAEKVMIGRVWGADAVGLYGRAFQLISIPTDGLNSAVGEVAFAALSRLQRDPARLRSYFLKGFSLVLGLTMPITLMCALFARDVVYVLLGPNWMGSIEIVRLLAPTIAILAIINPLGWLMYSLGMVARGLKIALVFAPIIIAGYCIGLPYGPAGIAIAYSTVMSLWVIPHVLWCVHGTDISAQDILLAAIRPLASGILAGGVAYEIGLICGPSLHPVVRLALESSALFVAFFGALLFIAGQRSLYVEVLSGLRATVKPAQVTIGAN